ncbi:DUF4279 domain-containing protein [Kitasatospora sp. NPDC088548]|uniref:DUF4279 domain-containing protein n=1 Tax=Kitasatospora sp. NPDC088548 TaxID=3364075 RepID=UPI003829D26A
MSAFRIYLRVVSSSLQLEEISSRLGTTPDESTSIGSRRRPESPPRSHTTWVRRAEVSGVDARPEDLEPVILGWGKDFSSALGRLVTSTDAVVSLEIVQQIRDIESGREKGIFLGADLIAWLGAAGASLDIDQYIYHECGDGFDDAAR